MDLFGGAVISPNTVALVGALGALPFVLISLTSFVKLAVVLSLLRQALGIQQIPPNIVIYSIAVVLSVYVMLPVALQVSDIITESLKKKEVIYTKVDKLAEPFVGFTEKHTFPSQERFFRDTASRLWGDDGPKYLEKADNSPAFRLIFLMPAFMISELTRAFQIGFLLYLPFIVIDLIVANVLLALGMSTLSPVTISLPIKLLLFVGLDGWKRLLEALVLSYAG